MLPSPPRFNARPKRAFSHLIIARIATQVQRDLNCLIDARRAQWISARLEFAERADRQRTLARDQTVRSRLPVRLRAANPIASSCSAVNTVKLSCSSAKCRSVGAISACS